MRWWYLFAFLVTAGCGSDPSNDKQCRANTQELARWMNDVAADLSGIALRARPQLELHDGPSPTKPGHVLELARGQATFDGHAVGPPGKLGTPEASTLFEKIPPTALIYVAIDSSTRWAAVMSALSALDKRGFRRAAFLFVKQARAHAPAPRAIDAQLSSRGGPREVLAVAGRVYRRCKPARAVLNDAVLTHEGDHARQATLLAERLPGAIFGCGCKVELGAVRSIHWFLYGSRSGHTLSMIETWLEVHEPGSFETVPEDRAVALGGAQTWRDAVRLLAARAAGRPVFARLPDPVEPPRPKKSAPPPSVPRPKKR